MFKLSLKKFYLISAVLLAATALLLWFTSPAGMDSIGRQYQKGSDGYTVLIQIDEKKLYVLQDGQFVKKYTISTGKAGYSSPIGDWVVVNKGKLKDKKGLGPRWLGLNVPWGNYGIHGTNDEGRIGMAVSHGCIRMRNRDIIELYAMIPEGTPVIIRNGPYGVFGYGFKTLKAGQRGADVLAVQKRLKELGYFTGWPSGIYGDDLNIALRRFQRDSGLPVESKITHDDYTAMGFVEFE